jgi:4-diphosphocytidyl-2-C-methyl-D-erythritol kinase
MIKSFSKINLFLKVLKKNKKNLHNIQSNTVLINLYDEIKIQKINKNKDQVNFIGRFKKDIYKKDNSIIKALDLLRKNKLIYKKHRYKITINKKIPVFSGLGGGTSNAFFLIDYFLKGRFNQKLIQVFEKIIGSDFRLFFFKNSIQKNLKNVVQLNLKKNIFFTLVYPNLKCSTKKIYSKVKKYSSPISFSKITSNHEYLEFLKNQNNDLQTIVENKYPKIRKLLVEIRNQKNCMFSRMTGSGSACFGLFTNKKYANFALTNVKKKFPSYFCTLVKNT